MTPAPVTTRAQLPDNVSHALRDFVGAARDAFGDALVSAVLYGSAAEGRLRATSDVNVLLVLSSFDAASAARLAPALRMAEAAVQLHAMFLLENELPAAVEAFAEKFDDVLRRRQVIHGADPFASMAVPRDALRARLRQTTLNLVLRMRHALVARGTREEQLALALAASAGPMRSAAASLLELEGRPVASPKDALETIVAEAGHQGWRDALAVLSTAREDRRAAPGAAGPAHAALIEVARLLHARASALR
jgi:predicted nucleotidyltransferase